MGVRRVLQGLAWSGAGLLVAAFLIGYAAPYLPPARFWWTDLFAVLLPALAAAVGLLGIGLVGQGAYSGRWGRLGGGGHCSCSSHCGLDRCQRGRRRGTTRTRCG
ncbi:hypothetical protein [Salinibacter pepae]|uniref:hypothetical protein n=1 Tax=Salinibacter pepae TaxID=3040382 RepID=UPI0021E79F83|nr:hypothetical protein [Salinibacter pepae]